MVFTSILNTKACINYYENIIISGLLICLYVDVYSTPALEVQSTHTCTGSELYTVTLRVLALSVLTGLAIVSSLYSSVDGFSSCVKFPGSEIFYSATSKEGQYTCVHL